MHVSREKVLPHAKSYTSIYDLFGSTPFSNIFYKNKQHNNKDPSGFQTTCGDNEKTKLDSNSNEVNPAQYVTSEQYHLLNKEHSFRSVAHSTSTIFYDLDDIAKRHSFHSFNEISSSNVNLLKIMRIPMNTNGFNGKSTAIVQECATQIQPKLIPKDSIEVNSKKVKKGFPHECFLSSEIYLRDDVYYDDTKKFYNERDVTDRHQKFWSFAKYRTEYTNPIPGEKKHKKRDSGKRTEDPCPCQLFSYACPCTDKKSLTELAKNSKSLTVADQITSTSKFGADEEKEIKNNHKSKKSKNTPREDKLLNTDYVELIEKYELIPTKNEPIVNVANKHDMPTITDVTENESISNKSKAKSVKKHRKIKCPKCRENVEVLLSTTDEEESMKYVNSSLYRFKDTSSKHKSSKCHKNRNKSVIANDNCDHEPRCELVPVCQILPTDNIYMTHKCLRKQSNQKTSPKIIRITKACRHHPPCTVVPSCQRANVLKNNCEFIPPCLHRPRCVNLPLCVPLKNLHYEEPAKTVDDTEAVECPHIPKCKYYPECQYEALGIGNNAENNVNIVSQMQNAFEYLGELQQPPFTLTSKMACAQNISSPSPVVSPTSCNCCKSNKSCQYNCPDCKCNSVSNAKNTLSNEAVIFIRDVGCQFRNKRCSPNGSYQSKFSSASCDFVDVKMGNYYSNGHTLRYEDKYTSPMVDEDISEMSVSIISLEIDSQCPTHGGRASRKRSERTTGFIPKPNTSPYVAYTTQRSPVLPPQMQSGDNEFNDARLQGQGYVYGAYSVKSRRSFMKNKYKKMFSVKRRRKSRASHSQMSNHTRN